MRDYRPELAQARVLLDELLAHARAFDARRLVYVPPVMDRCAVAPWRGDDTHGYKKFVEMFDAQDELLRNLETSPSPPQEDPLPYVQALCTSWKTLVLATGPIPAVRINMQAGNAGVSGTTKRGNKAKKREAFIDVVARGGAEWVRIYSKKIGSLLAEFREADSYLTSSDESDDEAEAGERNGNGGASRHRRRTQVPDNSLLRLATDLIALAASAPRIPGASPPRITLRLSRIAEAPEGGHADPRVPGVFAAVRALGVRLVFGDLRDVAMASLPTCLGDAPPHPLADLEATTPSPLAPFARPYGARLQPSRRINLDPTALMGLCSDILHHPLPADVAEARARFYRPKGVVHEREGADDPSDSSSKPDNANADTDADPTDPEHGQSQNSRELVRALVDEMASPVIEELAATLTAAGYAPMGAPGGVELWATRQAVRYLQETISSDEVIGDGAEQRRMRRLTGLEEGDFWEGSRYEGRAGVFAHMRLRVFDEGGSGCADGAGADSDDPVGHVQANQVDTHAPTPTMRNGAPAVRLPATTPQHPPTPPQGTPFHASLASMATSLVDEYNAYTRLPPGDRSAKAAAAAMPALINPRRLPAPRVAHFSVPFTIVSLDSLARAAREGMTTLAMGHVVFREVWGLNRWRVRGWAQGRYGEGAGEEGEGEGQGESGGGSSLESGDLQDTSARVTAAVWLLPYRSLGEAKRIKFARGDYSFPRFVKRVPKGRRDGAGEVPGKRVDEQSEGQSDETSEEKNDGQQGQDSRREAGDARREAAVNGFAGDTRDVTAQMGGLALSRDL